MVEGDIKAYFDMVDHQILGELISRQISDQRFMDLYFKSVKAGYVEDLRFVRSSLGVPQGGIISPILANIYLHEFDKFMMKFIELHSTPSEKRISKVNPKMH
jgi:retron-type reverse transcriptase